MHVKPVFKPETQSDFSSTLRNRVNNYFEENSLAKKATTGMKLRAIALIVAWIGVYMFLILGTYSLAASFVIWGLLGVLIALVTVNVGHDAIHGAFTDKKWLKDLLSHTFNINGASAYLWKISHNHAHHSYTNMHDHDEDISPGDFLRISPSAKLLKLHRYQHFYAFLIYPFATLSWIFAKDYIQFFQNKIHNYNNRKHPTKEYFYLFFYKILNYILFLGLPLLILPFDWYYILIGFLLMHLISGFYLAIVFMLAHAVEEVEFPNATENGIVKDDWMIHQLKTSANFSSTSTLANFFTGGLNTQIEHHLFANICSVHYRYLAPIVQKTCQEYEIPYHELGSFSNAIGSHYRFLKSLGKHQ